MGESLLRLENIVKRYNSGFSLEIPHLELQSGMIYSIIGPNGAGKTTLLAILDLLDEPDEGELFFKEEKVGTSNSLEIRRRMGMVMQDPYLFHATVYRNITSGLRYRAVDKRIWKSMAKEILEMVGLEGFDKRYAPELSRGESQRVAIARILVFRPEVLFLDEPFTNIDKKNVAILEELIKTINRKYQTTIIFTTHDLVQADRLAGDVISLVDGRVIKGSLENLFIGNIRDQEGSNSIRISQDISVAAVTGLRGRVHVSIPPQEIKLSLRPFDSNEENSFKGVIKKVQIEGDIARVFIQVSKEAEFVSIVPRTTYEKMGISINSPVFLAFKTASVMVF
jgi:tungstate transport system ATP-binding protein